ncbi:MAG: PadR family transcriptional regulator [Egibacteraceae bacterium]
MQPVGRITLPLLKVLREFALAPTGEHYGLELARSTRLPSGTVYPILARLEHADWVTSDWEDIDEAAEGRRRRRYYRLTGEGAAAARAVLEEARDVVTDARPAPEPARGQRRWKEAAT